MNELQSTLALLEDMKVAYAAEEAELKETKDALNCCKSEVDSSRHQHAQLVEEYNKKRSDLQETVEKFNNLVTENQELMVLLSLLFYFRYMSHPSLCFFFKLVKISTAARVKASSTIPDFILCSKFYLVDSIVY
jgi:uncharacterized membrane protein (DUF485 family)